MTRNSNAENFKKSNGFFNWFFKKKENISEPIVENDDKDIKLTTNMQQTNEEPLVEKPEWDDVATLGEYDPKLDLSRYQMPTIELLINNKSENLVIGSEELDNNKNKIVEIFNNYKIQVDKIDVIVGPTMTLYEIVPASNVRISKIKDKDKILEADIALRFSTHGIQIIAPMPGKGTIGILVPNPHPEIVSMYSMIASQQFQEAIIELPIALGKNISNEIFVFDLTQMPHLLIAGSTGQGKSVAINVIITSILYKKHPSEIKFVLIDPKMVELPLYSKIERHFLAKRPDEENSIITDNQKVLNTLNSLVIEMGNRYELLKAAQSRNIKEYNEKFISRRLNPVKGHKYLPYIVLIIDEYADLIITVGKEIEKQISCLAQKAHIVGIHLIIATQRPTTNIITDAIKTNFSARIAFRVNSQTDSRTILDSSGANKLTGCGDLLFSFGGDITRVKCAFIDTREIEELTEYIGTQQGYPHAMHLPEHIDDNESGTLDIDLRKRDPMFDESARLVVQHQQGSTSLIQRKFSIGYNRAGRIIDQLEAAGIVGVFDGRPRQVLFTDMATLENHLMKLANLTAN